MILRPMQLSDTRLAALFLVSMAVLGFEIEVMRVFAVASWSNFGSKILGMAQASRQTTDLDTQMHEAAANQEYEQAAKLRDQLGAARRAIP